MESTRFVFSIGGGDGGICGKGLRVHRSETRLSMAEPGGGHGKSKSWQGVPIHFKLKKRKNVLPDLISQMRKIKT